MKKRLLAALTSPIITVLSLMAGTIHAARWEAWKLAGALSLWQRRPPAHVSSCRRPHNGIVAVITRFHNSPADNP